MYILMMMDYIPNHCITVDPSSKSIMVARPELACYQWLRCVCVLFSVCVTSILRTSYTRTQTHYIHTLRAVLFTPHIVCHMNCKSPQLLPDLPSALRLSGVCEDSVSVMHIDIFGFRRTEVVQTNLFNLAFLDRLKDTSLLAAYS